MTADRVGLSLPCGFNALSAFVLEGRSPVPELTVRDRHQPIAKGGAGVRSGIFLISGCGWKDSVRVCDLIRAEVRSVSYRVSGVFHQPKIDVSAVVYSVFRNGPR